MLAIDSSATPYYSMVISLARLPPFSIAIHPMSVVHCKKVNRLRQVCHYGLWVTMDYGLCYGLWLAGSGRFSHPEREKLIDGAVHFCRPLGEGEMTATV